MWFFGFSTSNHKNWFAIGAIFLVILLTLLLKKLAVCLEAKAAKESAKLLSDQKLCQPKSGQLACSCGRAAAVLRTYGLEELRRATRDFRVQIGVGATSFVYLAELGDGRFGAVKRVLVERGGSRKVFMDEVSVLLRISHPNLVGLLGFCLEKDEQLLLLEYVPNKSLFEKMHTYEGQSSGILTWSNRLTIALDISRGLAYLHSQADPPIIHRDVKSSNILLVDDRHAKLADFGLCKLGHDNFHGPKMPTAVKGSYGYIDPHYMATGIVSTKSDAYSFGVLLLELITGLKSSQGSVTLPEWTCECRRHPDCLKALQAMLDPKLKGDADFGQVRVLIGVANSALVENPEARPEMGEIVDRILTCMEPQMPPSLPV